jgi:CDP-paratose 2-epimerase
MKYKNILITGGAGFIGSNVAVGLKEHFPLVRVIALDNLRRKGSELNVPRLDAAGVEFLNGDVRNETDLKRAGVVDLVIECAAEPSVMAGVNSSPRYAVESNLVGAFNCLELCRQQKADIVFFSTSRVYPVETLNTVAFEERATRFSYAATQQLPGVSMQGIRENFPLDGVRTLYGATKLSAEFLLLEYVHNYGIRGVINRFGVISGPWQFGAVDQGVVSLWVMRHAFKNAKLSYIGFGGMGKQVRDVLHVDDALEALLRELEDMDTYSGQVFNIGGGEGNTFSLVELTALCQEVTGNSIEITASQENRPGDVRGYVTDYTKFSSLSGWVPKKGVKDILKDTCEWVRTYEIELRGLN